MRRTVWPILGVVVMFLVLAGTAAAEMPDILGIQLGMPARDAYAKLEAALPKDKVQVMSENLPTIDKPVIRSLASGHPAPGGGAEGDQMTVDATLPPNKQIVWRVTRQAWFASKGIPKTTLLASLREKYGKETRTNFNEKQPATDDRQINNLLWLFDEQGRPTPLPSKLGTGGPGSEQSTLTMCVGLGDGAQLAMIEQYANLFKGRNPNPELVWCYGSFTAVVVSVISAETPELYTQMRVVAVSLPLALHAAEATSKWKKDIAEGQHKQDIEKAKQQEKPKL